MSASQMAQSLPGPAGALHGEARWQSDRWLGRWRQEPASAGCGEAAGEAAETASAMPFDDSDQTLVDRVKAGDVRAFEMLHRRYYARIYRFAFLRLGNAEDASDVACTTFCNALKSIHSYQFRRSNSIYPWLHQIASNLVVDVVRTSRREACCPWTRRRRKTSIRSSSIAGGRARSAALVERSELQEVVRRAIGKLPADQARALSLRFLADLSIREIAHALDRSEGAVKSLLHRALEGMRQQLKSVVATSREEAVVAAPRRQERARTNVQEVLHLRQTSA